MIGLDYCFVVITMFVLEKGLCKNLYKNIKNYNNGVVFKVKFEKCNISVKKYVKMYRADPLLL